MQPGRGPQHVHHRRPHAGAIDGKVAAAGQVAGVGDLQNPLDHLRVGRPQSDPLQEAETQQHHFPPRPLGAVPIPSQFGALDDGDGGIVPALPEVHAYEIETHRSMSPLSFSAQLARSISKGLTSEVMAS